MALRQSTSQVIRFGPFVDSTDGVTAETGLTITQADMQLSKDGAAFAQKSAAGNATHDTDGWYTTTLSTTDTGTTGEMRLQVNVTGALPVFDRWDVVEEIVFDSVFASGAELFSAEMIDAVWDEVLIGATHNVTNSSGRRLRQIQENLGYEGGAVWLDTVNGAAGTEPFENGTVENPSDNIADTNTLLAALGLSIVKVLPGSSITFATSQTGQVFDGMNWVLALGGQSIVGTTIKGATVSGIVSGVGSMQTFLDCVMNNTSHIKGTHILSSGIAGTQTVIEAGDYFVDRCHSSIAGTSTPTWDFGTAIGNTNLSMRHYSGGIQIEAMGDTGTDTMSLEGHGQFIEGTCTGGVVAIRGHFTTSGVTNLTLSDDARYDATQVEDAVWDTLLTGSTHNISTSAGRRVRTITGIVIRDELAQGPGTGNNQIQFDVDASATDGAYDPALVGIISGTGSGQMRLILQYEGSTKTATVDRNWKVNPDSTSEFIIAANPGREHVNEGLSQGGTSTTVTLNVLASASDNAYNNQTIFLRSGTGEDQARLITAYNGITKVATVNMAWGVTPDTTTAYVMLPTSVASISETSQAVWDLATSGHVDAGTFGAQAKTVVDAIETDTQNIQSRLPDALVSGNLKSNMLAISGSTDAADNLEASTLTILAGTASGTPTVTTMVSDLAITVDDQFNGRVIIFLTTTATGGLTAQATDITGCIATTNELTFTSLTTAPVSGDTFVIV